MAELEKCGALVKCWDYLTRPCVRPKGHDGGCNPFSDTDNSKPEVKAALNAN